VATRDIQEPEVRSQEAESDPRLLEVFGSSLSSEDFRSGSAHDTEHNSALALKSYLEERLKMPRIKAPPDGAAMM
jgi:hypothetical protein